MHDTETDAGVPVRFHLDADGAGGIDPGLLARVIAPFCRRGLNPDDMRARRSPAGPMRVELHLARVPLDMVRQIEGNLRQIAGVTRVEVELRAR